MSLLNQKNEISGRRHTVPWRRSLRFKLVIAAVTVEFVMLSVLLVNSFRLLDHAVELQTQARLEALSPLLDAALAGRVFQRDHTEVKAILTRLTTSRFTEISYLTVRDTAGHFIASTAEHDPGASPREDHSVAEALSDLTYDVRLPLTILGNAVGSVHFGLSLASIVATQDQVVREGMIIAAVEIFLSMLLLATGGYLITRHIRSLTDGTRRVAQGDYSVKITIPGHDEIAMLAADFNTMSAAVAAHIDDLRTSEDAVSAEKERLAVTLRSIGDGVITTDTSGRIVLLNAVAEKLTGWSQHEAEGRPLSEVFHIINEKTRTPCENPVEKVMASGRIVGLANHTALIAKDGSERQIADSGAPIRDRESRIIGVVLVFRDVTEKHRIEEELLKVKKLESVGVLAGGIAHDFNNILSAILGNINLSLLDGHLRDETRNLLTEAEKASLRARDLTRQLLTFSKGGEPVKETASIGEIIGDSAEFVLHGSNVACSYAIPPDLWLVDIDKGQMSQVIQNIIINAKHAMPGGGYIRVDCKNMDCRANHGMPLSGTGNSIQITISDSGIGIPANILDKIFDPYFTTKQEGSGLGLAITHSIINRHNGHISVQSKQGEGTTFTIYLPATKGAREKKSSGETMEQHAGKATIMIMDDEIMVRDVSKAMLERLGHEVVTARHGEEAIELFKQHRDAGEPIDIIIMDLTIPGGMGGQDAVKEILAMDPDAKVIVSSGYSNDPIMAHYREHGFVAAIIKPFRLQDITKALNQLLQ